MGHMRVYSIGDAIARFKRLCGYNVLHPMGFDAFGLPAENAAIKLRMHPGTWTEQCMDQMRAEFRLMGFIFDWEGEAVTCQPEYYRWNQQFFLKMFEKGLAYRKAAAVNWCPLCNTVLANEQVINGNCWRHTDTAVEIRQLAQWFFKITAYADELLADLDQLDWLDSVKVQQRNWIGRSQGTLVNFKLADPHPDEDDLIQIFTTRPDTLYGVTFMVFAPEHPRVLEICRGTAQESAVHAFVDQVLVQDRFMRTAEDREKEGVYLGRDAINPLTGERVRIFTANFVLMEYGTGAIMAVPAHDQRDFEFAKKYKIPVKVVIQPPGGGEPLAADHLTAAYTEPGIQVNSHQFNGMDSEKAKDAITEFVEQQGLGRRTVQYRIRDWLVSRQRYWGTPIPMVYCDSCGIVQIGRAHV